MLLKPFLENWLICIVLLLLFFLISAGYAYRANAKLADDDPKKREYYLNSIFLAPFTWPFFLFTYPFVLVLRVLAYGLFLMLFAIALVVIRKPFVFKWLDKIFTSIGNKLLWANTFLIRVVFGK
jgi:hypothetical protein